MAGPRSVYIGAERIAVLCALPDAGALLVFDLSFTKLLVLAVLALVIFGPDQLPKIAAQAGRALRDLRRLADMAKADLKEGLGPEFADFDINDLDPRNFVRKHLLDDLDGDEEPAPARLAPALTAPAPPRQYCRPARARPTTPRPPEPQPLRRPGLARSARLVRSARSSWASSVVLGQLGRPGPARSSWVSPVGLDQPGRTGSVQVGPVRARALVRLESGRLG